MRIISGKARGTKLYTLEGDITRPTLDRVKESLFNIIQNDVVGSSFLDMFSGSGAIGLESASRGAKEVILCEKNKEAISVIKKNIEKTHLDVKLYEMPYEKMLESLDKKIDIVYIDPPYKTDLVYESVKKMLNLDLLGSESLIIIETDEEKRVIKQINELEVEIINKRKYGRVHLIFLKRK